jgi:DNA-binding transcriptional regulator LsrR (DeoR family)
VPKKKYDDIVRKEIESLIWDRCLNSDLSIPQIAKEVSDRLQLKPKLARTDPYPYLREAAREGRLRYEPYLNKECAKQVERRFKAVSVKVVDTALLDDLAHHAAEQLTTMIEESARKELTIGFSGGYTTKKTVQALAQMLKKPAVKLPEKLVFVALVAGFDPSTPGSDPTSVFTYLDLPELQGRVFFHLLHTAPIGKPEERGKALQLPGIKDTAKAAKSVDIIVTSVAQYDQEHRHGMLEKYYTTLAESHADAKHVIPRLRESGWIGDMVWQPIGEAGPIDMSGYPFAPLSLVRLKDFPELIEQKKMILLVAGPCGYPGCQHRKDRITEAVLRNGLVTHAILDTRTAKRVSDNG